ncbi:MAG: LPXTG cell wall anchor domain-containing protein [Oscillospiraceae bacterium]|nr:LPXTG cell wall anchor domain-containing protein [Oscillospiraceae bacterium]
MKTMRKIFVFALALALAGSVMALTVSGSEDYQDAIPLEEQIHDAPQARSTPLNNYSGEYGADYLVEGSSLATDFRNAPAVNGEQRIPRLETPENQPQAQPIQEEIETPFVPAPNTGYASSPAAMFGAISLLASALLFIRRRAGVK